MGGTVFCTVELMRHRIIYGRNWAISTLEDETNITERYDRKASFQIMSVCLLIFSLFLFDLPLIIHKLMIQLINFRRKEEKETFVCIFAGYAHFEK